MTDLNSSKQQADDDITWLARNVHRWIDGDYLIRVSKVCYTFRERCEGETVLPNWHTCVQWLTRRAELQNKPSWKDAPKWAIWLGQCHSGKWEWYGGEGKPVASEDWGCWGHLSQGEASGNRGEVLGDWRNTLERRPTELSGLVITERERVASELVDVMMAVPVSDRKTASESYMSMALAIYDHLHQESKS